jgi:osmotically-inducible protein OsmY
MDGDVVLTGNVPSYPQYVQAVAVAARAAGVRCVRNHLQVALPPGDHRDDLTLAAMASDALTLGGAVPEGVEELTGVRSVRNEIQILDLQQP